MNEWRFDVTIHQPSFALEEYPLHTDVVGSSLPDAFGSFRVLHQIGAGALGPVFRAYDAGRDRLIAVKLFQLDLEPDRVHRLVGELNALVALDLDHRGLVRPIEVGIVNVAVYLAQEFVAADSLDVALRDSGPIRLDEAVRTASELADALETAAATGLSHGNLHPRDVLLASGEARLTGIGIASALARVGVAVPVRRPYASPERVAGYPWDRRADVFGLAALVCELLSARRIAGIGAEATEDLPSVRGADMVRLRQALARGLAEDPAARFETAPALVDALRRAVSTKPSSGRRARPVGTVETVESMELALPLADADGPGDIVDIADLAGQTSIQSPAAQIVEPELQESAATETADLDLRHNEPEHLIAEDSVDVVDVTTPQSSSDVTLPAFMADASRRAEQPAEPQEVATRGVMPLVLALIVGLGIGFAAGYGVGGAALSSGTDARVEQAAATPGPKGPGLQASPTNTSGLEFTEVAEPRVVAVPPVPGSPAPVAAAPASPGASAAAAPVPVSPSPATRANAVRSTPSRARVAPPPSAAKAGQTTGSLMVVSRPTGASVFINEKFSGTTPMLLEGLTAGDHSVRLDFAGYRRWTSSVSITSGSRSRVNASLEK